jgi:hypothetical protein
MALGYVETIITAQGDGGTLTAAAAASALPAAAVFTFPANYFNRIGMQVIIEAAGRISSVITTPGTARYDWRFGSTAVFDSQAILLDTVAAHTTKPWWFRAVLTLRAIGTSANFHGVGMWANEGILGTPASMPKGGLVAMLPWNTTPAVGSNFDSTVANVADFFFTQTVNTGSMTLHQYSVQIVN